MQVLLLGAWRGNRVGEIVEVADVTGNELIKMRMAQVETDDGKKKKEKPPEASTAVDKAETADRKSGEKREGPFRNLKEKMRGKNK